MGCYTLQLVGYDPTGSEDESQDSIDGWHVVAPGHPDIDGEDEIPISIIYPLNKNIEKEIRRYLELLPVRTPWALEYASKVQKVIGYYGVGLFRQLDILHDIGRSPGVDIIIIDVAESSSEPTAPNIFEIHWEVLENPEVWDELWAIAFPSRPFQTRKPVPKVMVRRTLPLQVHIGNDDPIYWSGDDLSDDGEFRRTIVTGSFVESCIFEGRRTIMQSQEIENPVSCTEPLIRQKLHIKLGFFRILLVIAREIDTQKDDASSQANESTGGSKAPDLDPSLISEPLLETIARLRSESIDVHLEICRPGSWSAMQSLLEEKKYGYYDLVHFDLHGKVLRSKGAGLYFASSTQPGHKNFGRTVFIPARQIGERLREAGVLMVALNACESGKELPGGTQVPSTNVPLQNTADDQNAEEVKSNSNVKINLAKTFVECGIPCVLAMSYRVTASFVTIFYRSFYSALLKSRSDVCEAASIARQSLLLQKRRTVGFGVEIELEDWIIPVLYQSHNVTFEIESSTTINSAKWRKADAQPVIPVSTRNSLFRRAFGSNFWNIKGIQWRQVKPFIPLTTERMHGRELHILHVEALIFSGNLRRTLFLSGKYGIGKTHFVKGLANLWVLRNCISEKPVYIDCSANPEWKAVDVLRAMVQQVLAITLSMENIEKARASLRGSQRLVIIDNVKPENISETSNEAIDAGHSLQDFIQSLKGGKSILIVVSREDFGFEHARILKNLKGVKKCAHFFELPERDETAIQEVTLDMLRSSKQNVKLDLKQDMGDIRRFTNCLDNNPQLIDLFIRTMSKASQAPNMKQAVHNLLCFAVRLPLEGPESRMARIAHTTFTRLGTSNDGHTLQKMLLCLAPFNKFIPCGLDSKFFFPSAKCYLGFLTLCGQLNWPASADASIIQQDFDLSKNPLQRYLQLHELANGSENQFCVLIEELLRSGLLEPTAQSEKNSDMRRAVDAYYNPEPTETISTKQLLMKLPYLRINPILTHYLRSQFFQGASEPLHGLSFSSIKMAYCTYYKSFSVAAWTMYASNQAIDSTAPAVEEPFTTDSVFLHDACNIYGAVHGALSASHPTVRWFCLPSDALVDLLKIAVEVFNDNVRMPFKPLPTGPFTEETILRLFRTVLAYYDSAPRAERMSITPLTTAANLSYAECLLLKFVGSSVYSDIDVYKRCLKRHIKDALTKAQKLRKLYGTSGESVLLTNERILLYLLEDVDDGDAGIRRAIRKERWAQWMDIVRHEQLFATAIRGGLRQS